MTSHFTEIPAATRADALPGLLDRLTSEAARLGAGADDCLKLRLLVEELFLNTVDHGLGGKTGPDIRVQLAIDDSAIRLCYIDQAPPFDPVAHCPDGMAEDAVGGLGLPLILGLCQSYRYRRDDGCNILELTLSAG